MFKKYYENTRHFKCVECGTHFKLSFWQWIGTLFHNHITRHAYVKCPYCKTRHWLKSIKIGENNNE